MDEREAFARMTDHFARHNDGRKTPYLDEAVAIWQFAACKQIPERPKNVKGIFDYSGRYYTTKGDCPNCGEKGLFRVMSYCYHCGQKLDWDFMD